MPVTFAGLFFAGLLACCAMCLYRVGRGPKGGPE